MPSICTHHSYPHPHPNTCSPAPSLAILRSQEGYVGCPTLTQNSQEEENLDTSFYLIFFQGKKILEKTHSYNNVTLSHLLNSPIGTADPLPAHDFMALFTGLTQHFAITADCFYIDQCFLLDHILVEESMPLARDEWREK